MGNEHSGYFEKYFQKHDPFDQDRNIKHTLNMHHFHNIVRNPSSLEKPVISMVVMLHNATFINPNQLVNQTMVEPGA